MKEKKKAHGIQLLVRAVVRDPEGKIVTDTGRKPAKSFLIQFLEFIYAMGNGATFNATDQGGNENTIYHTGTTCNYILEAKGPVNEAGWGIQVGTGDTGETNTDYVLETKLYEGVGAGNITHGVTTIVAAAVVGANVDVEIYRPFTNNTGSTIIVKETGIMVRYRYLSLRYHLLIRDVFPGPVTVPDKFTLTIYYTLRTTV